MIRTALYTLGCKLNQCESEALADAFSLRGFEVVSPSDEADLYIVNTCTVTTKAEQKARRMIRKFASRQNSPAVLVTGCYAEVNPDELSRLPGEIILLPLSRKPEILFLPQYLVDTLDSGYSCREAVRQWVQVNHDDKQADPFSYQADTFHFHARAFLKIEDGCDNECSYCRVTLARGDAVSLERREVVRRALDLEADGYREIVLTGVNITAYRSGGEGLAGLLRDLTGTLRHARIRLSSLEPDMISEELIELCAHPLVQPHFHLPVQSGSAKILESVNRHYMPELVKEKVDALRARCKDPFIAADFITGLPGEGSTEAEETVQLIKACEFSQLHVFPYSPRPGTELYGSSEHVAESIRDERAAQLRSLSHVFHHRYLNRWLGEELDAVLEQEKSGYWQAIGGNYLRVQIAGVPEDVTGALRRRVCRVKITEITPGEPAKGQFISLYP